MAKITMQEIAKLSGVSLKTVSRVLNNSNEVKDKTKEKVLAVASEYRYNVNLLAKWLRQKKTNIIIIFVGEESLGKWSSWRAILLQKMVKESKSRGYRIIVSASSSEAGHLKDNTDGFNLLKSGMADGAIMFDSAENDIRINYLRDNKIPFVIFGKDNHFTNTSYVDLDNFKAGYLGGKFLIQRGHKKICLLINKSYLTVYQDRINGFKKATEIDKSIEYYIKENAAEIEDAYKLSLNALENEKPNAFFVLTGDSVALGVYKAIQEKQLVIPDDIAVLSINNLELCNFMNPSLSSIDQSTDEFAHKTLELLLELIENKKIKTKRILIEPKVIERNST